MSLIQDIVVFLCGLQLCIAQMPLPGPCPKVQAVQNFEGPAYLGRWFEAEKYFFIFELGGKCVTADYSDLGNGVIGVKNTNYNTILGKESSVEGTATQVDAPQGKLAVSFYGSPGNKPNYWVLDTDYTSYSLVWSCSDFRLFHLAYSWILTREQNPSPDVINKAYEAVDRNKINRRHYMKTDQTDCGGKTNINS